MGKFFKFVLNIILILVLLFSGFSIYKKLEDYKKASDTYEDLRKEKEISKEKLLAINSDYKLWLEISETNIDYPVVQGKDNEFYLHHDFNKEKSGSGTIFMDYRNDYYKDENVIFYGHNMRNKSMFNNLQKFKDEEFFNNNNLIKIHTGGGTDTYEVFSVYVTKSNTDYLDVEFDETNSFEDYIETVSKKSMYPYKGTVTSSDKIITLSTCSYEFDNARTVVHAKLID